MASLRRRWAERAALCVVGAALRQLYVFVARRRRARELPAAATSLPPPPHILLVLLDDAGLGDASVLGHPLVRTPHVDAFFASAVRFTQAYAGAPNCSPSRAALLTGRAPFRTGVYDFLSKHTGSMHLSRGEQTVASLLAGGAAYDTLHLGKWHLSRAGWGGAPEHFGFAHSNRSFSPAAELVAAFEGWLSHGRRPAHPFFALLALWEPHEPVERWSPPEFRRMYHRPASGRSLVEDAQAAQGGCGRCVWRRPLRGSPAVYYGCLSQADAAIGRALAALERRGLRDDTLVALTSDNGPEHRERNSWGSAAGLKGAKGFVYEGGIRVPLALQWPKALRASMPASGRDVDEPVQLWDLLPTLCAAASVPPPADRIVDGVNLLPLLFATALPGTAEAGSVLRRETPLFWAMHRGRGGMQYALREGDWKLLAGYGRFPARSYGPVAPAEVSPWLRAVMLGRVELYRLSLDPTERVDVAAERPDVVARLLPVLQRLVHETARDGALVTGWSERSPPCPRWNRRLNLTEHCCASRSGSRYTK